MKKLPVGIQAFIEIINQDYLYIDKMGIVLSLIERFICNHGCRQHPQQAQQQSQVQ